LKEIKGKKHTHHHTQKLFYYGLSQHGIVIYSWFCPCSCYYLDFCLVTKKDAIVMKYM